MRTSRPGDRPVLLLCIMNGRFIGIGGGMEVTPGTRLDDGQA